MFENTILDVGLDVHKNTTAVATANGRSNGKVRFYGNGLSGDLCGEARRAKT